MTLRSPRERIIMLCAYEICALGLSVPFYALQADRGGSQALITMLAMMLAEMIWAMAHDYGFDRADFRLSGRVASARPRRWRVVHALSREGTTVVVTLPVLIFMGGHGFTEALLLDLQLTLLYAGYAFVFYVVYDRIRPVVPQIIAASHSMQSPQILLDESGTAKA